jgi:hypothetical protein
MAQTGYEGLAQAIQSAFDTYWRRRQWREQREEMGKEREFQVGMETARLGAAAGEARLGREFATSEREAGQKFTTSEREAYEEFTDEQRDAAEKFEKDMDKINRDFEMDKIDREEAQSEIQRAHELLRDKLGNENAIVVANIYASAQRGGGAAQTQADIATETQKNFLYSQVQNESAKITKFIKDKNNSFTDFKKQFMSINPKTGARGLLSGVQMDPHNYKRMQEEGAQALRESFVRKNVAAAIKDMYLGGAYLEEIGPATFTGPQLDEYFRQWTEMGYEMEPYTPPTGKEQITEAYKKVEKTPIVRHFPIGPGLLSPAMIGKGVEVGKDIMEKLKEALQDGDWPRMPKFLKRNED